MLRGTLEVFLASWIFVFGGTAAVLQIGVEQFAGIQFRRVTGRIEYFDLVRVLPEPSLDGLGAMRAQVVEDKEDLLERIAAEALEKVDRDAGMERSKTHLHRPPLPLVRYRFR